MYIVLEIEVGQGGQDPQVENAAIDSHDCEHLRSSGPYGRVACLVGSKLLER